MKTVVRCARKLVRLLTFQRLISLGFSSISFLFLTDFSGAAILTQRPLGNGNIEVILKGEIVSGDAMRTAEYIDEINSQGGRVESIALNSEGGLIYEGYLLAKLIILANIDTVVQKNYICYSSCFIAFIAGKEKFAYYKSKIAVHNASNADGQLAADATILMVRLTKTLGATNAVVGKMASTPPSRIEILTTKDLEEMGVKVFGKQVVGPARGDQCQDPICEFFDELFK